MALWFSQQGSAFVHSRYGLRGIRVGEASNLGPRAKRRRRVVASDTYAESTMLDDLEESQVAGSLVFRPGRSSRRLVLIGGSQDTTVVEPSNVDLHPGEVVVLSDGSSVAEDEVTVRVSMSRWLWREGLETLVVAPEDVVAPPSKKKGGLIGKSKLIDSDKFAAGQWQDLLVASVMCSEEAGKLLKRQRRRDSQKVVEANQVAKAMKFVQLGELSAGRHALEGAELAPGTPGTLRAPRNRPTMRVHCICTTELDPEAPITTTDASVHLTPYQEEPCCWGWIGWQGGDKYSRLRRRDSPHDSSRRRGETGRPLDATLLVLFRAARISHRERGSCRILMTSISRPDQSGGRCRGSHRSGVVGSR